jgi:hypothetical protein
LNYYYYSFYIFITFLTQLFGICLRIQSDSFYSEKEAPPCGIFSYPTLLLACIRQEATSASERSRQRCAKVYGVTIASERSRQRCAKVYGVTPVAEITVVLNITTSVATFIYE